MLVLTSTKANIVAAKPSYIDYIFYTDLRIDPLKFKILHSIEFFHEKSDYNGLFHVYVLFGGSGEEYYVGTFYQRNAQESITFSGIQQLNTIDVGSNTESVVTVRVYRTDFISDTVHLAGHTFDGDVSSNYISTLNNLDGTNYNAVAGGILEFNKLETFPFVTVGNGYIDFTAIANAFGVAVRFTHGFRYRTSNTNVRLFSFRDDSDQIVNIEIDENGKLRMNGHTFTGINDFRHDDNIWRMIFVTPLHDVVRAHVIHGESEEISLPILPLDFTPTNIIESYIGGNLVKFDEAETVAFFKYVSADGTDTGSLGTKDAIVTNAPPAEVVHDGRSCLFFNPGPTDPPQVFNLSAHASSFELPAISFSFWFWLDSVNGSNGNSVFCIQDTVANHDLFDIFVLQRNPIPRVNVVLTDNVNGSSVQKLLMSVLINTDVWNHVTVVVSTDNYKMYLNGQEPTYNAYSTYGYSGFNIDSIINNANLITIGSRSLTAQYTNMMGIYIDGLTIFSRALDDADAQEVYNNRRFVTGSACDIAQIYSADKTIFEEERAEIYSNPGDYEYGDLENWKLRMKIEQV